MWLIDCRKLTLVEVDSHVDVRYAILSHTWEAGEEVQFDEFKNKTRKSRRGWDKIRMLCRLAVRDGYELAWCDTCCINKTSSAEITEAINSMFPWYAAAGICYVYLADYAPSYPPSGMGDSRWFTRGWTLQELVAPARIRFYDASWRFIGTKATMSKELADITNIEEDVLLASKHRDLDDVLSEVPIARRMSWAARRETTRIEDMAYCLLGIFGVNLPLLYGEGYRAFTRLQEEIVKTSNDLSLFAWLSAEQAIPSGPGYSYSGVFAQHPKAFIGSGRIALDNNSMYNSDFTISNKGIKVEMSLWYLQPSDLHVLWLNCFCPSHITTNIGIYLKHQGANIFARARPHEFTSQSKEECDFVERKSFFLNKLLSPNLARSLDSIHFCAFVISKVTGEYGKHFVNGHVKPETLWDGGQRMFITVGLRTFAGCYQFQFRKNGLAHEKSSPERLYIYFGYGYDRKPWLRVFFGFEEPFSYNSDLFMLGGLPGSTSKVRTGNADIVIRQSGITVELKNGIKNEQPVYVIDCGVSNIRVAKKLWSY